MRSISILGSSGSIGTQALSILKETSDIQISALAVKENIDILEKQIAAFNPEIAAVENEEKALELKHRLSKDVKTEITAGIKGLLEAASASSSNLVLNAIVGFPGLLPSVEAIKAGKNLALANKETLVAAGEIVMNMVRDKGVDVLPVDSEHSAIFQCLRGNEQSEINRILLTASGGPFRNYSAEELKRVTLEGALKHPVWSMGKKISVDSATMMNKGLEVIEAHWLFGVEADKIDVVVHPQSIIHSMVEFRDSSVMAQLGLPDMRLPIQYAVNYPKRYVNSLKKLDLLEIGTLTFEKPNTKLFPCLKYAYDALKTGGLAPTVLNAANEAAVNLFIQEKIPYVNIERLIEKSLSAYNVNKASSLDDVIEIDRWAREYVEKSCGLSEF